MPRLRHQQRKRRNGQSLIEIEIDKPILIVEDQDTLSQLLADLLEERYGCEVHIANNYAQAKIRLNKHRYDYHVAICDLNLPDAPNGEIIDLVNKAKVEIIALTGTFGEEMRETMLEKGVIDYITKESINAYEYVVNLIGRLYKNRSIKALVVEDALSSRALLKHMLTIQKFSVLTANNGIQALQLLEQHPDIRLLLTDYNMPEMDGFTLTVEARKNFPKEQLAIIGISAVGQSDLGAQFMKNGANDFLMKPFSYEELLCRINQNIEMLEYMEAIRTIANRDYLTKLYNRRFFFNEGEQIYTQAKDKNKTLTVGMIDIDHFKQVNDTYGHDCGDEILIHFANLLNEYFDNNLVARLGGEEFSVIISHANQEQAFQLLDDFRQLIADTPALCGDESISISVSIGFNNILKESLDAMLKIADENLYHAKQNGRNQVVG